MSTQNIHDTDEPTEADAGQPAEADDETSTDQPAEVDDIEVGTGQPADADDDSPDTEAEAS